MKFFYRRKRSGDRKTILKERPMSKQLYVGNLSPETNEALLKALFMMFGAVEKAYVIPDPQTGKCKGYGFVVMRSDVEAQAAIKALDGKKCGDYTVKVEETRGKIDRKKQEEHS